MEQNEHGGREMEEEEKALMGVWEFSFGAGYGDRV